MRRFWIGLGLLAGFLLLGIWGSRRMITVHEPIGEDLELAGEYAAAQDWDRAAEFASQAKKQWERHRNFSAALHSHQPIDEIDAQFRELEVYLAHRDTTACQATCVYLAERLQDLSKDYRLSWWNLL